MGVRLNILANPAIRTGLEPSGPTGNGAVAPDPRPFDAGAGPRVGAAATPEPQAPARIETPEFQAPEPRVAEVGPPAVEPAQPRPADAQPAQNEQQESNRAPVARLRDFRFLSAAESIHERDLEVRLDRLELELESASRRLQFSDSFAIRSDAQLDRARLRSDLEVVQSEIGRLRLQRVFGGPVAQLGATGSAPPIAQAAPAEAQPPTLPASEPTQSLNLLA